MADTFERGMKLASVILVPLSIAVGGHFFGLQLKNAELESLEQRFVQEHKLEIEKQKTQWRITKSEMVYKFMDALSSEEELKRKIAIEAIMIALPEDGPRIVQVVAKEDPNEAVQAAASQLIDTKMQKLLNDMFHDDKEVRVWATESATSAWINHQGFMKLLLEKSINELENTNGVWNALVFLESCGAVELYFVSDQLHQLRKALSSLSARERTLARLDALIKRSRTVRN